MNPDLPKNNREELEANVTAFVLGELPPEKAAQMRDAMVHDPKLATLYTRLSLTAGLLRETASSSAQQETSQSPQLKLAETRRQELLQLFKTATPSLDVPEQKSSKAEPRLFSAFFASLRSIVGVSRSQRSEEPQRGEQLREMGNDRKPLGARFGKGDAKADQEYSARRMSWLAPVGIAAVLVLFLGGMLLPALTKAKSKAQATSAAASLRLAKLSEAESPEGRRSELRVGEELARVPLKPEQGPQVSLNDRLHDYSFTPLTTSKAANERFTGQRGEEVLRRRGGAKAKTEPPSRKLGVEIVLPSGGGKSDSLARGTAPEQKTWEFAPTTRGFYDDSTPALAAKDTFQVTTGGEAPAKGTQLAGRANVAENFSRAESFGVTATPLPANTPQAVAAAGSLALFAEVDSSQKFQTPAAAGVPQQPVTSLAAEPAQVTQGGFGGFGGGGGGGFGGGTPEPANRSLERVQAQSKAGAPAEPNLIANGFMKQYADSAHTFSIDGKSASAQTKAGVNDILTGSSNERDFDRDDTAAPATAVPVLGDTPLAGTYFRLKESESFNTLASATPKGEAAGRPLAETPALDKSVVKDEIAAFRSRESLGDFAKAKRSEGKETFTVTDGLTLNSATQPTVVAEEIEQKSRSLDLGRQNPDSRKKTISFYEGADREENEKRPLAEIEGVNLGFSMVQAGQAAVAEQKAVSESVVELQEEMRQQTERDSPPQRLAAPPPVPQPEVPTSENPFSTFSLNVSDVSFKLAAASLENGAMPEAASVRSEEFINAFDYRDPEPAPGAPMTFNWERAAYPFAQNRDLLRFSVKTAAQGREAGRAMNLVLLLDNSGSMERADRVAIIREALRVLGTQLHAQDKFTIITFSRTARLCVDGIPGNDAGQAAERLSGLTPEGGTNLEEALNLAYEAARRHFLAGGINRVVLLTDGAANLGDVEPEALKQKVEQHRKQGIALDCFGIGWEGFNDDLLEVLSRNGDGRYGFINTPAEAATGFASQLAGALKVAASDLKVQVEFNPSRVTAYRQIGYAKHQLTKEQFRDNTVDAAEIGAAEAGNALYVVETNPQGQGPLATVRVRYKTPGTSDYAELEWSVPYNGSAAPLDQASPALRLAGTASTFSEWLTSSPYAGEVTTDRLLALFRGVPETYGADPRPKKLEWMIRQAKSITGK